MKRVKKKGLEPFYYKSMLSTNTLASGASKLEFFKKQEAAEDRNYNSETNPFSSGKGGRVMGLYGELFAPGWGAIQVTPATSDILDSIAKIRNAGKLEVKIGGDLVHEDLLANLLPAVPTIFKSGKIGDPKDVVVPADYALPGYNQSPWILRSSQLMIPFQAPLPVDPAESFEVIISFFGKVSVPANLAGYILALKLSSEVLLNDGKVLRTE